MQRLEPCVTAASYIKFRLSQKQQNMYSNLKYFGYLQVFISSQVVLFSIVYFFTDIFFTHRQFIYFTSFYSQVVYSQVTGISFTYRWFIYSQVVHVLNSLFTTGSLFTHG